MTLRLGDRAPDFVADTTIGPVNFHDWLADSWGILLSHPRDFTPICTTEIGSIARLEQEFDRRDCKVIALSMDSLATHRDWIADIEETQKVKVEFPIIADTNREIANLYSMICPEAGNIYTVRSLFIIAPDKTIRLISVYPGSTGRNFDEVLRALDSLQLTEQYPVGTPAQWSPGEDCLVLGSVSDQQLPILFPEGCQHIRPYLRIVSQPRYHPPE